MVKKAEPKNPLSEVFGFPTSNKSERALHFQTNRLCPFNNVVPNCTKVNAIHPEGVCSVLDSDGRATIICQVRFQEDLLVGTEAAAFLFPEDSKWMIYPRVKLKDASGKSAGTVDMMLVSYNDDGFIADAGALEILAPYKSRFAVAQLRNQLAFARGDIRLANRTNLSYDLRQSSREELLGRTIPKLAALRSLNMKLAIAVDDRQFPNLVDCEQVKASHAEISWLTFGLHFDKPDNTYRLTLKQRAFTSGDALQKLLDDEELAVA